VPASLSSLAFDCVLFRMQDDARIYPSKEDVGPLTGSAGGFAGGERGLQHFLATKSLEPAPSDVVSQRQTRRDAIAAVGVSVVATASYIAYLFLTGQPLPEVPDFAALTSAPERVTDAVSLSTGVPALPGAVPSFSVPELSIPEFSVPDVSDGRVKVAAAAAAVVISVAGGTVVFRKTKEVVADTVDSVKTFAEANLTKALVIAAAAAVYYVLLR
jgi:hypothetical protein